MSNTRSDIDFQKLSPSAWKQLIQFQLDGQDYAKSMIYHSLEGIDVKPFYTKEDVKQSIDFPNSTWKIDETIMVYDHVKASQMAKEAIEFGAVSIHFILLNPNTNFNELLAGIDLIAVEVKISLQQLTEVLINQIAQSELHEVIFCIDPISKFFVTGNWYTNQKVDFELLSKLLHLSEKGYRVHLEINNYPIAQAGAHSIYQLALCLAHTAEYLHYFESVNQLQLLNTIYIRMGVGTNYFFEIAKIRALRLLVPSLTNAFNLKLDFDISCQTHSRYYTAYNSVQNLVRSSTSLLAAVLSSADRISGLAHDHLIYHSTSASRRLIRDQLLILKHEAGLVKHQHAANGSYYINYLTDQMAQKALQSFKLIEKNKGIIDQLRRTVIQKEIKNQHLKELTLFQKKEELLIGMNAYEDKKERLKKVAQRKPFSKKNSRKTLIVPITARRIAESWEEKRWNNE